MWHKKKVLCKKCKGRQRTLGAGHCQKWRDRIVKHVNLLFSHLCLYQLPSSSYLKTSQTNNFCSFKSKPDDSCMPTFFHQASVTRSPLSHRQQLRNKEPVSHPKETHHPAEWVCWSLAAVGLFLCRSLSILHRPAHCWKGQMRSQGRYRGRRGRRGWWRRWWRGGAGWGMVPLRGQGCRWLQCAVQMSQVSKRCSFEAESL